MRREDNARPFLLNRGHHLVDRMRRVLLLCIEVALPESSTLGNGQTVLGGTTPVDILERINWARLEH
eukprot:scaffold160839_cov36-Tisochrysis_lutea.AAC.1